jgi:hypothetical protein
LPDPALKVHIHEHLIRYLIAISIAISISIIVVVIIRRPALNSPEDLLQRADQMAWRNDWFRAVPYYAQSEVLFNNRHDSKHALFARVSQIPVKTQSTEQLMLLHELDSYLRLPEASDPEIRKGQVRWVSGNDVRCQIRFIGKLFELPA